MKLEAIVLSEITQKRKTNAVMIPLTCVNLRKSKLIKAEPRLVLGRGWGQVGDMWRCWSKSGEMIENGGECGKLEAACPI